MLLCVYNFNIVELCSYVCRHYILARLFHSLILLSTTASTLRNRKLLQYGHNRFRKRSKCSQRCRSILPSMYRSRWAPEWSEMLQHLSWLQNWRRNHSKLCWWKLSKSPESSWNAPTPFFACLWKFLERFKCNLTVNLLGHFGSSRYEELEFIIGAISDFLVQLGPGKTPKVTS